MKRLAVGSLLIFMGIFLLRPVAARCEFYQYEDENGNMSFTDDPASVPKKFKKKKLVRDGNSNQANSSITRVSIVRDQVLVPVTVAYRGKEVQATFLLDTGANSCTISPDLANRLNIDPKDAKTGLARVVGGGVYVVGATKLDYVIVGPNRKYDVGVSIIQGAGNFDGLLGMNFLRELRYHIDFDSNTIKWGD